MKSRSTVGSRSKSCYNSKSGEKEKMIMKKRYTGWWLTGLVFLMSLASLPRHVMGYMVESRSETSMIDEASLIVRGECVEVVALEMQVGDSPRPTDVTRYTFNVDEWLKGSGGSTLVVYQLGIAPQADRSRLSSGSHRYSPVMPPFSPGWKGIVFWGEESSLGFRTPIGFDQGVYDLIKGKDRHEVRRRADVGRRPLTSDTLQKSMTDGAVVDESPSMELGSFQERIRARLREVQP